MSQIDKTLDGLFNLYGYVNLPLSTHGHLLLFKPSLYITAEVCDLVSLTLHFLFSKLLNIKVPIYNG